MTEILSTGSYLDHSVRKRSSICFLYNLIKKQKKFKKNQQPYKYKYSINYLIMSSIFWNIHIKLFTIRSLNNELDSWINLLISFEECHILKRNLIFIFFEFFTFHSIEWEIIKCFYFLWPNGLRLMLSYLFFFLIRFYCP